MIKAPLWQDPGRGSFVLRSVVVAIVNGASRVTVLPLLYRWPDNWLALGYATVGLDAYVGHVPMGGDDTKDLMAIAGSHEPQRLYGSSQGAEHAQAMWLLCVGWGGRLVPLPGTLDWPETEWSVTPAQRTMNVDGYGSQRLTVGALTLKDPERTAEVELMLKEHAASAPFNRSAG